MEADGFLETSAYTFHDSGKDPITEKERSIPIYNQIDSKNKQVKIYQIKGLNSCIKTIKNNLEN
jgi:hypothetical protein